MKFSKKIFIATFLALMGSMVAVGLWNDTYFFIVKNVQLEVAPAPLEASLNAEIQKRLLDKVSTIKSKNIWSVSLQKLRENILSDVWIESVIIEREFPQQIVVQAKIKQVIFIFVDNKGRILPVTDRGQLLNPISLAQAPDVPVIRSATVVRNSETLSKIIELYKTIPREGHLNQKDIAEIDWSPISGMKIELVKSDDGQIILGLNDVGQKVKRVSKVLKYLESQKQKWRVIDASFSKKVLVRLRKHS